MSRIEGVNRDAVAWTDDGAFEVADGVHRIPLPLPTDGLKAVNAYLLESATGPVLVDPGWAIAESRNRLEAGLGRLGVALSDIRLILVTHVHRDHFTQAIALRREFGTQVALGAGEESSLRFLTEPGNRPLEGSIAELRGYGADALADAVEHGGVGGLEGGEYELPDSWLTSSSLIDLGDRTLTVIPTPGHTHGHVVFHDPVSSLLFSGDHVLPHITPSIGFEPVANELPLRDYLDSLRLLQGIPDARLLPAHGPPTSSTHARVEQLLEHHDERLSVTLEAIARGGTTAFEVATLLTWTRHRRTFESLDRFNQMLAVLETGRHLDLLGLQNRLDVQQCDGIRVFSLRGDVSSGATTSVSSPHGVRREEL